MNSINLKPFIISSSLLLAGLVLTGCGGGGSSNKQESPPVTSVSSSAPATSSSSSSDQTSSSSTSSSSSSTPTSTANTSSSVFTSSSSSTLSTSSSSSSSSTTILNPLATLIRDQGGLFLYEAEAGDISRGGLIGTAQEAYETYQDNAFVSKALKVDTDWMVLGKTGWSQANNTSKVASFEADGSVTTLSNEINNIGTTISIKETFDLAGQNVLSVLQTYPNTKGMLATINPSATFANGAKGYTLNTEAPNAVYSVYYNTGDANGKCWGGEKLASASGGNCLSLDFTKDNNTVEQAVSGYSKIFSENVAINTTGYRAAIIGGMGPNRLEVQIVNDAQKTVKFYESSSGIYNKLLATSTWSEVTLPYLIADNKAVHFTIPESVFIAAEVYLGEENPNVYIAQQNGYLRNLTVTSRPADANEWISFNVTANTSITNATANYLSPLTGSWSFGDGNTLIFINNNTFVHVKSKTDDPNCLIGSALGTYSWNPITFNFSSDLLTDSTASEGAGSCAIGGEFKFKPNNDQLILTNDEGDYIFTKVASPTGLAGSWIFKEGESDYTVLLLTNTQYFLSDYHEAQGYGTESGTYTFNTATNQFTPKVLKDNNDDAGFSDDNNQPRPLVISTDKNSFVIGDDVVFKRVK